MLWGSLKLSFFNWDLLHAMLNSYFEVRSYEKKKKNILNKQESCLEGTWREKVSINSRLEVGVRAPIQFRKERHSQYLKRLLFLKNRPIHFLSCTRVVKRIELRFSTLKSARPSMCGRKSIRPRMETKGTKPCIT